MAFLPEAKVNCAELQGLLPDQRDQCLLVVHGRQSFAEGNEARPPVEKEILRRRRKNASRRKK